MSAVAVVEDTAQLRRAFTLYPHGVMAVAADIEGVPVGLAVSAFVSVSLDPPLILLCFDKASSTWPRLKDAPSIGVSVLAAEHAWLGRQLASRTRDRFDGASFTRTAAGALLLDGAPTRMSCIIERVLDGGDHHMVLLRVDQCAFQPDIEPLVWHDSRFREMGAASL